MLPTIGDAGEQFFSGQAMHHAQLHDVQAMIKGARHHGQARTRLLVERPESEIVAIEIVQKGADAARE